MSLCYAANPAVGTPPQPALPAFPMNRFVGAITRRRQRNRLAKPRGGAYETGMRLVLPLLFLALSACNGRDAPTGESTNSTSAVVQGDATAPLRPTARAVTIGEGGAGIAACVAHGRVVNLAPGGQPYLPVRSAPFADAPETARLVKGARVFVCTQSIDQKWRGIVIPPADNPNADCGVSQPIASVQPYAGPCVSGWIASAFLELGVD